MLRVSVLASCVFLLCSGLAFSSQQSPLADKKHHIADGFKNNYPYPEREIGDAFEWMLENASKAYRKVDFPLADNDAAFLRSNTAQPTLTWVGHATFLLQAGGRNLLTDPHFTGRASPLPFGPPKRLTPVGLALEELPHIHAVVISHNHYDHLDEDSILSLARQPGGSPVFLVPLGVKSWFVERGVHKVIELDWWEQVATAGLVFHFVPAQHFSSRSLLDRNKTLWGGWVVDAGDLRFYFAGDTGYSQDFADIGARFPGIDLAAIPIGAYAPRDIARAMHVNPEEAVKIHQDVGAAYSVGMHWGTFRLTLEPLDEPPQRLAQARAAAGIEAERFFVMQHGETRQLGALLQ